jgi:AmmeMemoRadiSam system protein A
MGKILGGYLFPHPPIILEEIGKGQEIKALCTIEGVKTLSKDIKEKAPDTIIIITPHGPLFSDAISISKEEDLYGDFKGFGHEDIKLKYKNNLNLVNKIIKNSLKENIIIADVDEDFAIDYNISLELDHGSMVPLYFINKEYGGFNIVHITYGLLSPKELYKFGNAIKKAIEDLEFNAVIVASGDLSHRLSDEGSYSYSPYGREFDEKIVDILKRGSMEEILTFDLSLGEKAGECGLRSLMIMAGVLGDYKLESKIISYEGPFGVGYCTAKIDIIGERVGDTLLNKITQEEKRKMELIRSDESEYVSLARRSLEYYIKEGRIMDIPNNIDKKIIEDKKGVFVTIYKNGMLRGCIGTIEPTKENLALEIINNAISAGINDPRFDTVEEEELESLIYSVDILSKPEPISSISQLDIGKYGVIVRKDSRSGLLLPNLDGVDSIEEQVSIALSKAGIRPNEEYELQRFEVIRHK